MLFLSTLHDAPVHDSALDKVGKLKDIIATPLSGHYAVVKAVVIRLRDSQEIFVPWRMIENVGRSSVTLTTIISKIPPYREETGDVRLRATVLDHQIIDVNGARVVRVNDLQLGVVDGKMSVVGIDVSMKGLLRRLRLGAFDALNLFKVKLIDWRQANLMSGGGVQVGKLSKEVEHIHPADLANIIEELNVQQGSALIKSLDLTTAARVFEETDPETQRILVNALGPEKVAQFTANMPIDEVVDLLKSLPLATKELLMARLQATKAQRAGALMRYEDRSAGGLMTTEFMHCLPTRTVGEVIEDMRARSPNFRFLHYLYVVDEEGHFLGVVSLRRLLLNDCTLPIAQVMRGRKGLKVLRPHQSLRKITAIMTKYKLFSVAVVDKNKKILGVVTIDDVMRALFPYA